MSLRKSVAGRTPTPSTTASAGRVRPDFSCTPLTWPAFAQQGRYFGFNFKLHAFLLVQLAKHLPDFRPQHPRKRHFLLRHHRHLPRLR